MMTTTTMTLLATAAIILIPLVGVTLWVAHKEDRGTRALQERVDAIMNHLGLGTTDDEPDKAEEDKQ